MYLYLLFDIYGFPSKANAMQPRASQSMWIVFSSLLRQQLLN